MHKLRERFAPVYFHHRATYEAAIKTIEHTGNNDCDSRWNILFTDTGNN